MAIVNGTCVSFCNQPEAHFGLRWVRPWDNRGKCYMDGLEREFNAGQTHRRWISIFNRLRARPIARYWSEIATFSYTLAFNAPVGGVPIGIPGKSLVLRKLES